MRVYALGELLWIPALVLKLEIDARRMQRYLLAFEILSAALIYSVGLYLIGQGGLYGAAVASAMVSAAGLGFFTLVVLRARRSAALLRSRSVPT